MILDQELLINTNMGKIPFGDYCDIIAIQNGFDDYCDMKNQGFYIDRGCVYEKKDFNMFE
jgi:hypothetical protein